MRSGRLPFSQHAWANSVHHESEDNDPDNSRQTTTRHKPKTRLNSKDPRCLEPGDKSVLRMWKELKTKKKLANVYAVWLVEIASKFIFGTNLTEEGKDDLMLLLFAYRELFISSANAPPAIDVLCVCALCSVLQRE